MPYQERSSVFSNALHPITQSLIVLGAVLAFMVVGALIQSTGLVDMGDRFAWLTAASFMLFFALFNSVFSLSSKNMNRYWQISIPCFAGLALVSGLLAWAFSSIPIQQAGSYWWIYIVVSFGYFVFLILMRLAKKIVQFAEREEWNAPKERKR